MSIPSFESCTRRTRTGKHGGRGKTCRARACRQPRSSYSRECHSSRRKSTGKSCFHLAIPRAKRPASDECLDVRTVQKSARSLVFPLRPWSPDATAGTRETALIVFIRVIIFFLLCSDRFRVLYPLRVKSTRYVLVFCTRLISFSDQ